MEVTLENLPPEVLAHIFTIMQDGEPVLGLQDRARGEAVCRRWRVTLAGSCTIEHIELDNSSLWLSEWLVKRQARITNLTIILHYPPLLYKVLPTLQREVPALLVAFGGHCEALHYDVDQILSLPSVLPQPHVHTPHLRDLVSSNFAPWDAGWMASLAQLSGLQSLELHINSGMDEVAVLPSMGALTALRVELSEGCGEFRLSPQPALQQLTLTSNDSPLDLRAGPAAFPSLQELRLSVDYGDAAVDFGGMARLRAATMFVDGQLEGAETAAAATALETLSLKQFGGSGDDEHIVVCDLEQPWVLELLHCLPRSLHGLELQGRWSNDVAGALAQLTQVAALALSVVRHGLHDPLAPYPSAGAPLWRSLRALSWFHSGGVRGAQYGLVPEGLQSAINVQLLQLCKPVLSSDEEDSVLSLPSLQRLYMPFCSKDMARSQEEEATVSKLQHSMHSGQTVSAEYLGGQFSSFVEAELAELQL